MVHDRSSENLFNNCNQNFSHDDRTCPVVGANLCVRRPLELKGKGIGGVEYVVDKKAYTVVPKLTIIFGSTKTIIN
jgi:hypothetical protein